MIVAEIIPITSSILTESLSYFSTTNITPGTLVTIPLRKKEIKGVVISTSSVKNLKQNLRHQNYKIRNILKVHDENIFSPAYLKTIHSLKDYFLIPQGKFISLTYPKYLLDNAEKFARENKQEKTVVYSDNKYKTFLIQKKYKERILLYKDIIEKKINKKESVHIICPTVYEVKKIHNDIKKYFPEISFLFHGKTTKKYIDKNYYEIKNTICIVISTANFVDLPIYKRTMLIVESDSSSHYRRVTTPKIDMRIFIEEYAKNKQMHIYFSDAILRPLRYEKHSSLDLENSYIDMNIFSPEKITLISAVTPKALRQTDSERIKEIDKKSIEFSPFSEELLEKIKESIVKKERIFLYTTRKSLAPTIMCRNCGKLAQDLETKIPYSLYVKDIKKNEFYYLNRANGNIIPAFDTCQFCGSWKLQTLGIGTEGIEKELKKQFRNITTFIIDSKHTKSEALLKKNLKQYLHENINKNQIIIGTQLALAHLDAVDSSYVVSIDGIFYQQSYSNEERLLLLLKKIYDFSKHTYIQTRSASKNIFKKEKITSKQERGTANDSLQIKFSQRLKKIVKNIIYSEEFSKNLSSRYTESLKVWDIIKRGNYQNFIKSKKTQTKTIIKITHSIRKEDYKKLYHYYQSNLRNYNIYIKLKRNRKNNIIDIVTLLYIKKENWTIENQDNYLKSFISKEDRNISIEINPENLS